MNLLKVGDITLNMDRVTGVRDHQAPAGAGTPDGETVILVFFDDTHIELSGMDAAVFRRWIRHNARNLNPRKSADGEDLVSPEQQLQETTDYLVGLIDRLRPKDPAIRSAAHQLNDMIDRYITDQLPPMPAQTFERTVAALRVEPATPVDPPLA